MSLWLHSLFDHLNRNQVYQSDVPEQFQEEADDEKLTPRSHSLVFLHLSIDNGDHDVSQNNEEEADSKTDRGESASFLQEMLFSSFDGRHDELEYELNDTHQKEHDYEQLGEPAHHAQQHQNVVLTQTDQNKTKFVIGLPSLEETSYPAIETFLRQNKQLLSCQRVAC